MVSLLEPPDLQSALKFLFEFDCITLDADLFRKDLKLTDRNSALHADLHDHLLSLTYPVYTTGVVYSS
jgi:hypothetical protein